MNFNLIFLLPKVFTTASKIMELLKGGVTGDEMDEIVDELFALVKDIPALQGFMGILQVVVNIAKVIIPALPDNPDISDLLKNKGIGDQEVKAAENVIAVLNAVEQKAVDQGVVVKNKTDGMSLDDLLKNV